MSNLSWLKKNRCLVKEFSFKNFMAAVAFINKVAKAAEILQHHPDIFLHDYKLVKITLTSHEAGGVTAQDRNLAKKINKIKK